MWKECPTLACRWFAGPLRPGAAWLLFPSARQGQQELSTHGLVSGAASGSSSRGSQGLESPLQRHLPSVFVRMEVCPAACQRSSAFRELLVFTGVLAHPRSLAPSSREEGTGRDTEEALKMWAWTRHLQSSHPPPPLRSRYLSNGKSL